MTEQEFDVIKHELDTYQYSSMNYCEYEEVEHYNEVCHTKDLILFQGFNHEAQIEEYHWASNQAQDIINKIEKDSCLITFIPHEWVEIFEAAGFAVRNAWHDYFMETLEHVDVATEAADNLKAEEYSEASKVTQSCRNQSRGFTGQSAEWIQDWLEREDGFTRNNAIFVWRSKVGELAGIICTATYGHESEKGAMCWIREVAVKLPFQNQGIARRLILQALSYGKKHGADRAFLAADECNDNAIHLYTSIGFCPSKEKSQIDLIK